MGTVIYGDVLVAVNFIINLMILGLTRKLTGIPVSRGRRYLGALVGALASFSIFLPMWGLWWELLVRLVITALVILTTYHGQSIRNMLRLAAVFFAVGFIIAGFVVGIWFIIPDDLLAFRNGIIYFNISPLLLLGCVGVAYLFVLLFDSIFGGGKGKSSIWQATITRGCRTVTLPLFMDTGNGLVEPFSGLPVMVVGLHDAACLLTPEEMTYIRYGRGEIPHGMRPVFFSGITAEGLLCAFRPDSIMLRREGDLTTCEGYLAVAVKEVACHGCSGIFNPRLLGIGVSN